MKIEKRTVESSEDFTGELARYIGSLEEVRKRLRKAAADLTDAELAARALPNAHQIGNLILHIGEAESSWIWERIGRRVIDEETKNFLHWEDTTERDYAEKGYSAAECLERIDKISEASREILAEFTDADLDRFFGFERADGTRVEITLRRVLVDLFDHEAVHRGQISMLKRILRET